MAAETERQNIAVVEIDPRTIDLLSSKQEPSFYGTFGDYRPPNEQTVGVGDTVKVTLWESSAGGLFWNPASDPNSSGSHSAATPEQLVAQDGSITIPFAGRVSVAGRRPAEIEEIIRARLANKAIDPQVLLTVTRSASNSVTVFSEGGSAARFPLNPRGERLLDIVAQTGGIRSAVADLSIVLTRDNRVVRVPLEVVLRDPKEDIYLRPGDVVAEVRVPQTFTAVGELGRNNVVNFGRVDLTLDEAIGKAGGLLDNRADPSGVFVFRFETGQVAQAIATDRGVALQSGVTPAIYHLDLRDPAGFFLARRFSMRNKDIVYVAAAPADTVRKALEVFNLMVTPAFTGAVTYSAVK
ncbi:MAG TPA: polysaccharide biosynthesis/export family protein [Candidatus Binataceae bacterium]|nr:polysaccharide biosynthesis/export family protein [Candidatus Binataceae bacterium]